MEEKIALINQMKTQHFVMVCTTRGKTSRKISTIQQKYRRKGENRNSKIICSGHAKKDNRTNNHLQNTTQSNKD